MMAETGPAGFSLPPGIEDLRRRVRAFLDTHVLPVEIDRDNWDAHDNIRLDVLEPLRTKARAEGLWAPQAPRARGGMGLPVAGRAVLYEEANRSIFGPVVFNCAAPDDGNIDVLCRIARPDQQDEWLQPIIDGAVRSAFAMTEPAPGGGSDPGMIRTRAERHGDVWRITGRKWFITGAAEAAHFILIARTDPDPEERRKHLTAFLFHRDQPGWQIVRRIGIMGPEEHGGHCELAFDGLEIPDRNRLLEIGDGLKVTQIRLGTARLTHCMRWLGLAKRAMGIAQDYADAREGFGIRLADRESVRLMQGQLACEVQIGRLLVMQAACKLDQGDFARKEVSMAKIHVAETLHKAADTAIQICGARGYSRDLVLEWIYRYARQARLVDGASEVHRMVLADAYARERDDFWRWEA
jgi:acyl-CoA dehydrogenase